MSDRAGPLPNRAQAIRQGNFFHGVNPGAVGSAFRTDPVVGPQLAALEGVPPWRWKFGPRVYAVCAFRFRTARPGGTAPGQG